MFACCFGGGRVGGDAASKYNDDFHDDSGQEKAPRPPPQSPSRAWGSDTGIPELPKSVSQSAPPSRTSEESIVSGGASSGDLMPNRQTSSREFVETTGLQQHKDDKGQKHVNQYIMVKTLGQGTTGKVKLCLNSNDGVLYAIKVVNKMFQHCSDAVRTEIAIMKKLYHANVVNLSEVIDDPGSSKMFLVMDYVEQGPIFGNKPADPLPEEICLQYFRDIVQGLDYLHYNGVVHRDLKPENLLLAGDGTVKIADFGASGALNDNDKPPDSPGRGVYMVKSAAGTPAFMAPEILSQGEYDAYGADVWSLGICLYNLVYGQVPFISTNKFETYAMVREREVEVVERAGVSEPLRNLLRMMLVKDPAQRIHLTQVIQHDWVTTGGKHVIEPMTVLQPEKVKATKAEVSSSVYTNPVASLFEPVWAERRYKLGDYLFRKGDPASEMFFINEGTCEVMMDAVEEGIRAGEKLLQEEAMADEGGIEVGSPVVDGINSRASTGLFRNISDVGEPPAPGALPPLPGIPGARVSATSPGADLNGVPEFGSGEALRAEGGSSPSQVTKLPPLQPRGRTSDFTRKMTKVASKVLTVRQEGQFIGEIAMFEAMSGRGNSQRTASVRASSDMVVLVVGQGDLESILEGNKDVASRLSRTVSQRKMQNAQTVEMMMSEARLKRTESGKRAGPGKSSADVTGADDLEALKEKLQFKTVMYCEDSVPAQKIVARMMAKMGLTCHVAGNGNEIIDHLKEKGDGQLLDLLVMDASLPVKDGLAVTKEVRAMGGAAASTPIVLLAPARPGGGSKELAQTGRSENVDLSMVYGESWEEVERELADLGVTDFLPRPPSATGLAVVLAKWCSGEKYEERQEAVAEERRLELERKRAEAEAARKQKPRSSALAKGRMGGGMDYQKVQANIAAGGIGKTHDSAGSDGDDDI